MKKIFCLSLVNLLRFFSAIATVDLIPNADELMSVEYNTIFTTDTDSINNLEVDLGFLAIDELSNNFSHQQKIDPLKDIVLNNKVKPQPRVIPTPPIYQNPFMAPNNFSEIHNNSYQTDTVSIKGPATAENSTVRKRILDPVLSGISGNIVFNSQGKMITMRGSLLEESRILFNLLLIDPNNFRILDSVELPSKAVVPQVSFADSGYFYLNNQDRVVCVTNTQEIQIFAVKNDRFMLIQTYDLTGALNNPNDVVKSLIPDNEGRLWFNSKEAIVGYVNQTTGTIESLSARSVSGAHPRETNIKSLASDENGGVYAVTNHALYRFQAGLSGKIEATWRTAYDRGARKKPGQNQQGSGTAPTLFNDFQGNRFVTIADNADPVFHVLVYNRDNGALVAQQAVFTELPSRNATENSLIAVNHSIIVENNYGNLGTEATLGQRTTEPGIARVDFNPDNGQSEVVWRNLNIAIPSAVTKLSTADGLIYTYAKDSTGWYWATINFRNGRTFMKARVPPRGFLVGPLLNNFYSGINFGPDGSAYVGILGGVVTWRPITTPINQ